MRITKIETIQLKEHAHTLWVQVYTDSGIVGLGETFYAPSVVAAAIHDWFGEAERDEWTRAYVVTAEVRQRHKTRRGKARKRIDLQVETTAAKRGRPLFLFEAKRFYHRSDCVAEYVGTDGLGGFLAGDYARDALHAGMLGYVQKGTNLASIQKVEAKLSNERSTHGLAAQGPVWSTQCLDARLGDTYVSQHTRQQSLPSITLYHSFLRCCP